jgi:hypothetical protein
MILNRYKLRSHVAAHGNIVMPIPFNIAVLALVLLSVGCKGLTPGRMDWVQPKSEAPHAGNVYLVRGLIGVFSTGMDELSVKLNDSGVRAHVFQGDQRSELARTLVAKYKGVENPEPLCLIGHSYGADDVLRVAHTLEESGIKVDLLVTVDATTPPTVPTNVAVCYNYYQSQVTDFIPMFRGIPLKQEKPGSGTLVNTDLRKDRTDLLQSGTNHINIDKNELVQNLLVRQVLEACPPRDVWAARHGGDRSLEPQKASARLPASPAGQVGSANAKEGSGR